MANDVRRGGAAASAAGAALGASATVAQAALGAPPPAPGSSSGCREIHDGASVVWRTAWSRPMALGEPGSGGAAGTWTAAAAAAARGGPGSPSVYSKR